MTAASLGIAHQRGGRLASVAGILQGFAEIRDRLLVATFTVELIEKLSDWIAPRDVRREFERQPLHDGSKITWLGRARSLRRGRSAENGARNEERQQQSQPGNARARHAMPPVRLWRAALYPQMASASSSVCSGTASSTRYGDIPANSVVPIAADRGRLATSITRILGTQCPTKM